MALVLVAAVAIIGSGGAREGLTAESLLSGRPEAGILPNSLFTPPGEAQPPIHSFAGTLRLAEVPMQTEPELSVGGVLGRDPRVFPEVEIGFFSHNGDLVPTTRDVIRRGTSEAGTSYWDMIVQPGRVWSEPGDEGWSRAAFPFALVHSLEGTSHNGLATFLYNDQSVSRVSFQIVQQTSPYYVDEYFVAWGQTEADYQVGIDDLANRRAAYEAELADEMPMADLEDLAPLVGPNVFARFEPGLPDREFVAGALVYDGVIYHTPCRSTAGGDYPYCDRARFGVWSVTKSSAAAVALLRLAEKYGAEVFNARIGNYVADLSEHGGWSEVRFLDALNMATGMGYGDDDSEANINDGYMVRGYSRWYEARSLEAKLAQTFRAPKYPWEPGKVARYRDGDVFVLGAAMNAFLQYHEGADADIWDMVAEEVYRPVGIHHAPINRTIEPDGARGLPLMSFGQYLTLQDMAKIARLFHEHGRHDGEQILHAGAVKALLYGTDDRGLPTGSRLQPRYFMGFWYPRHRSADGCTVYIPEMIGWGGNAVTLMPGGITGIRIAKNWDERRAASDTSGMRAVGDELAGFCDR